MRQHPHALDVRLTPDRAPPPPTLRAAFAAAAALCALSPLTIFVLVFASDPGRNLTLIAALFWALVYGPWAALVAVSCVSSILTAPLEVTLDLTPTAWRLTKRMRSWRWCGGFGRNRSTSGDLEDLLHSEVSRA